MRAAIAKPPGSTAPGSATTTWSPTAKFDAPQTMPCGSRSASAPTRTWHQRIVLPFFCGSSLEREDLADDERTGEVGAELLDGLDLEAGADEALGDVAAGLPRGEVDELAQPGQRGAHQISIPKGSVKRTSPSTMSRMSATPWRNISVRSRPMPNAKPL